jgi:hypothetical protein
VQASSSRSASGSGSKPWDLMMKRAGTRTQQQQGAMKPQQSRQGMGQGWTEWRRTTCFEGCVAVVFLATCAVAF